MIGRRKTLQGRPVICLNDPETGTERFFESLIQANQHYGTSGIGAVCNGLRRSCDGLYFRWADEADIQANGLRHTK